VNLEFEPVFFATELLQLRIDVLHQRVSFWRHVCDTRQRFIASATKNITEQLPKLSVFDVVSFAVLSRISVIAATNSAAKPSQVGNPQSVEIVRPQRTHRTDAAYCYTCPTFRRPCLCWAWRSALQNG